MNENRKILMLCILFLILLSFTIGCGGGGTGYVSVPEQVSQNPTSAPVVETTPTQITANPTPTQLVSNPLPTQTNLTPVPTTTSTSVPTTKPLTELEEIQKAIKLAGAQWTAGETSVSILSKEQRKLKLGDIDIPGNNKNRYHAVLDQNITASALYKFTWFAKLTPVKDQGSVGACGAFTAAACLEARINIEFDLPPDFLLDLSEAQIYDACGGVPPSGGLNAWTVGSYCMNTGVPPEGFYPYNESTLCNIEPQQGWENYVVKIDSYQEIVGDANMKDFIYNYGPAYGRMDVYDDFNYYKGEVYQHVWGELGGSHAVCIYGWDDSKSCWLVKNSWGVDQNSSGYMWGENGCFKIKYGECRIAASDKPSIGFTHITVNGTGNWNVIVEKEKKGR